MTPELEQAYAVTDTLCQLVEAGHLEQHHALGAICADLLVLAEQAHRRGDTTTTAELVGQAYDVARRRWALVASQGVQIPDHVPEGLTDAPESHGERRTGGLRYLDIPLDQNEERD